MNGIKTELITWSGLGLGCIMFSIIAWPVTRKLGPLLSGRDYGSVLFFPCHGFCPNGFFHDQVFNESPRNTRWIIKEECCKRWLIIWTLVNPNSFFFITNTRVKYRVLFFSLCRLNEPTCLSINMLYFPFWLINHNFLSPFTFSDNTKKCSPLFSLLRHTHKHNNYIISLSLTFTLFLLFIIYKEYIYKYKTLSLILYNTLSARYNIYNKLGPQWR